MMIVNQIFIEFLTSYQKLERVTSSWYISKKSLSEQPVSKIKEFIASKTYLEYLAIDTNEI